MIEPTTNTKRLREAFYRIFKSRDPFEPTSQEAFPLRVVLYPTDVYYLTGEQFGALMGALHDCGEREFFVSMVESEPEARNWNTDENRHWVCKEPSFDEYMNIELFLENAIYSSSGSWGILISHEHHALLVCHSSFWKAFQKRYPNWEQDQIEFINNWYTNEKETGCDIGWLNPFLAHLKPNFQNVKS